MCWQGTDIQMQSTGQAVPMTQSEYSDPAAYSALSIIFLLEKGSVLVFDLQ